MQLIRHADTELIDLSLTRAAEKLGDITDPVMDCFYQNFPEAQATFETLGLGNRRKLEAEMIGIVVYCLMNWLDRPSEIRILLGDSVPHHQDTLHVDHSWYNGLVNATIEIITSTIPSDHTLEHFLWAEIRRGLCDVIGVSRPTYKRQHQIIPMAAEACSKGASF
jgi:hypothetical protein